MSTMTSTTDVDPLKKTGILTDRQMRWMQGDSNDYKTQNPVLYRHDQLKEKRDETLTELQVDAISVRGLLKNRPVDNPGIGNIIERTQAGRKERHETIVDDIEQELAAIALLLEPNIEQCCAVAKQELDSKREDLKRCLEPLKTDQVLEQMSFEQLSSISVSLERNLESCELLITGLHGELMVSETKRSMLISEILRQFTDKLVKIAHLMPADVHRLMEAKVNKLNESILSNQLSYADLTRRLMIACIDDSKRGRVHWESRVQDWRDLRVGYTLNKFKRFMSSEEIIDPLSIRNHMTELTNQHQELNEQRVELLNQLRMLKPPCTKASVHQWNNAVTLITSRIDDVHITYLANLHADYNDVESQCQKFISDIMQTLFDDKILPNEILETHLDNQFQILLGEQKASAEIKLSTIERQLAEVCADQKRSLTRLFAFSQGAAHEWDSHELALARIERTLQEQLDRNRREHDYQNQIKEAKLDIVMDRMRQDSSEEALSASLKQVMSMLEEIQAGYHDFNASQKTTCNGYPEMVDDELKRYTSAATRYFAPSAAESSITGGLDGSVLTDGETAEDAEEDKEEEKLEEIRPKIICSAHTHLKFLDIDINIFTELRNCIYENFLNHLPTRKEELKLSGERYKLMKIEEVNNELDLRLHLHEPRATRATQDVHNVRAAELLLHRERVTQHCQGLQDALQALKLEFQTMIDGQMEEGEKFKKSVEELEQSFSNATKPHQLKSIQNQVNGKLDEYMEVIRASVRHFRYNLDDVLNKLRSSNASLRKTLRIFSDGGNFSPDEVKEYRKKLEKSASRIDHVEGSLMAELEGMETKRMTSAREFAGKLEDRFKHHLLDLMFIDKVSRWLSNIQVKIKTEAAESNSQAQRLSKLISTMHGRIEFLENPKPGESVLSAEELHGTLLPIFEAVQNRLFYLNCAVDEASYENLNAYQRRLLEPRDVVAVETPVPPPEKEAPVKTSASRTSATKDSKKTKSRGKSPKKTERPTSRAQSPQKTTKKAAFSQVVSTTVKSEVPEKEEIREAPTPSQLPSSDRDFLLSPSTEGLRSRTAYRTHFGGKYDKKYMVFGEYTPADITKEQFHLLQLEILQVGLDGLLCTAEMYYKQKGVRASTRPDQIHESFDACAENLTARLKKYQDQMRVYANSCVQEFRAQLKLMLTCLEKLPTLLALSLITSCKAELVERVDKLKTTFDRAIEKSEIRKREHKTLLRPTLGHPNSRKELQVLVSAEDERSQISGELIGDFEKSCNETRLAHAATFVTDLNDLVWMLLLQCDHVITIDDVIIGTELVKPLTEVELLRKKMATTAVSVQDVSSASRTALVEWSPLLLTELSATFESPAVLKSMRNLSVHKCAIQARDEAFKDFCAWFRKQMEGTSTFCSKLQFDESRWLDHWNTSLHKIRNFYST